MIQCCWLISTAIKLSCKLTAKHDVFKDHWRDVFDSIVGERALSNKRQLLKQNEQSLRHIKFLEVFTRQINLCHLQ